MKLYSTTILWLDNTKTVLPAIEQYPASEFDTNLRIPTYRVGWPGTIIIASQVKMIRIHEFDSEQDPATPPETSSPSSTPPLTDNP